MRLPSRAGEPQKGVRSGTRTEDADGWRRRETDAAGTVVPCLAS